MVLYRYLGADGALDTISNSRLKVSKIGTFNDPFECMYVLTGAPTREVAMAYFQSRESQPDFLQLVRETAFPNLVVSDAELTKFMQDRREKSVEAYVRDFDKVKRATENQRLDILDQTLRVVCFSSEEAKASDEILLWSHYGDKHRGIRIGFEFPQRLSGAKIVQVDYRDQRVQIDLTEDGFCPSIQAALRESLRVKCGAWNYEREYRLMISPDACTTEQIAAGENIECFGFDRTWVRQIDFGTRVDPDKRQRILETIKATYGHVLLREAKYHETEYSLRYDPISV